LNRLKTILLLSLCLGNLAGRHAFAQSSVLRSGQFFKVAVTADGVYKITADQLKKMGFNPAAIDPRNIRIFGNAGGMLPQLNDAPRPDDLMENAIFVSGEDDGKFNSGDFILFYGQGPHKAQFNTTRKIHAYEHNLYSDKNFYFVTVSDVQGKRITSSENQSGSFPVVQRYHDYVYHEVDQYNILTSGREWFGERFTNNTDKTFTLNIPGIPSGATINVVSDVMAQAFASNSSFNLLFNSVLAVEQSISLIPGSQYDLKGRHRRDTLTLNASTVQAAGKSSQEITYQFTKAGPSGIGYLDFFLVSTERMLALYGDQTIFTSSYAENITSTFIVDQVNTTCTIWDITNPYEPQYQAFNFANSTASFSTNTEALKSFIVFNSSIPAPELIASVPNQDLHGLSTPDMIIVAYPDFIAEAQRLAAHRQSHNNWTVVVVTPQEIYNEFSSGRQDVSAIRDFAKHLYDKNSQALKVVLLFGKTSYDYKDRVAKNTNFVPTYESRNSLNPLETYSSDDYFGFLEDGKGSWGESSAANEDLDIGVGRLPVKTVAEASHVVDKIIAYDTRKKSFGGWRKNIVFVADDGSTSDHFSSEHQKQANTMAEEIESLHADYNTRKIFLGTYEKTVSPNSESIPEVNDAIAKEFDRGALIVNYTGHGAEKLWADEKVFTNNDIEALENKLYPFLVTATCEFGRHDDPAQVSSAELSILHQDGGSIGLVTTARPVYSFTNFALNKAFYNALFTREENRYRTLGEVFRDTKNNSATGVGNRNFSLLADPSLTLAMPPLSIHVTDIKTTKGSDTLRALSTVVVSGEVWDQEGSIHTGFTGSLEAIVFDKRTDFVTIGKNNPAFKFTQWYNALFRGKASVTAGAFEFQFIVPKNMAYEIGTGKLSLYAVDHILKQDASGASSDFKIGGSESNPPADVVPPTIKLFMGDTTFLNGGITAPSTRLIVKLEDESGINISNYGIGNNLVAILDNDAEVFVLSEYYMADVNTFKKGWVDYPIQKLAPGKHTLTVKAWDTHNNPAQASIDFMVSDGEALVVEDFGNYPNPFQDKTMFFFKHNRSGDDLEGQLFIYNMTGQQLKAYAFSVPGSPYQVDLLELDALTNPGEKLPAGLYFARLAVRSLTNGSKNEQVTKLIVLN
jgi:hypothetical protein